MLKLTDEFGFMVLVYFNRLTSQLMDNLDFFSKKVYV